MKKLAKIFLCLSLALMMSLSLMVPAFAADTCVHSFRVIKNDYEWCDQITSTSHRRHVGKLVRCSKCGREEGREAYATVTEGHVPGAITYTSNHSASNPAKHSYTKIIHCKYCKCVSDRKFGFTGCTASGCREPQSVNPIPAEA